MGSYVPLGYRFEFTGLYVPLVAAAVIVVWGLIAKKWAWSFLVGALLGIILERLGFPSGWSVTALLAGANVQGVTNFLKKERGSRARLAFQTVCALSSILIFSALLVREPMTMTRYRLTREVLEVSQAGTGSRTQARIDRLHLSIPATKETDPETITLSGGKQHYGIDKSMVYWHNGRPVPGSQLIRAIAIWSRNPWVLGVS